MLPCITAKNIVSYWKNQFLSKPHILLIIISEFNNLRTKHQISKQTDTHFNIDHKTDKQNLSHTINKQLLPTKTQLLTIIFNQQQDPF